LKWTFVYLCSCPVLGAHVFIIDKYGCSSLCLTGLYFRKCLCCLFQSIGLTALCARPRFCSPPAPSYSSSDYLCFSHLDYAAIHILYMTHGVQAPLCSQEGLVVPSVGFTLWVSGTCYILHSSCSPHTPLSAWGSLPVSSTLNYRSAVLSFHSSDSFIKFEHSFIHV
jgi:hypothetical protein